MKTSTKLVAAIMLIASVTLTNKTRAQSTTTMDPNPFRFGIGVETGIPTGTINKNSKWYLGGTARLQYNTTANLGITLTSGYYNFFGKNIESADVKTGIKSKSFGIVPVKAGIKGFISQNIYLSGEVGAAFETKNLGDYDGRIGQNPKNTKLIASPGIGWANKSWDVGARYENFSGQSYNYGTIGLRVAYGFGI